MNSQKYCCPKCGSDHTKSLSVIRNEGVARSTSMGWVKGKFVRLDSTAVSNAASNAAPPRRENPIGAFLVDILIYWFVQDKWWLKYWAILAVTGTLRIPLNGIIFMCIIFYRFPGFIKYMRESIKDTARRNDTLWERKNIWSNSYDCQRCGHRFVLNENNVLGVSSNVLGVNNTLDMSNASEVSGIALSLLAEAIKESQNKK